jgi:hypothetical protein
MAITKVNHPDLLDLASDTGATVFPKGTTAQRPVSPEAGYIRFNTTDNVMETYDGTEWKVLDTIVSEYSVDYLVVAGGGGSGTISAGSGSGGLRTSYGTTSGGGVAAEDSLILSVSANYTITVGAGGVGGHLGADTNGYDSVFSTITATGGGTGGNYNGSFYESGANGGSGGGGSLSSSPSQGYGTLGQGFEGGNGDTSGPPYSMGGGGGAAASGVNSAGAYTGAVGGSGLAVSITGSSIYYAGGGGGAGEGTGGIGGIGGGGNGGGNAVGTPGTNNTGGGAGGNRPYAAGSNGGSGIVILRMPTANYSGTATGSPTVTTDGSDTILTYTSSGTYTA